MNDRAQMDHRSQGRELALAVLCHLDLDATQDWVAAARLLFESPPRGDEPGEDSLVQLVAVPQARSFAETLLADLEGRIAAVDQAIRDSSKRWRLERMDQVDRNVIRLATGELMAAANTPRGVIVSEAVRLARRYGSERSVRFVNGVVETIATAVRPSAVKPSSGAGGHG